MRPGNDGQPDIIVMGASAGGVEALRNVTAAFPAGMDAAVFVVLHTMATAESLLPDILSRASALPAVLAQDDTPVETGRIYVAPPDRHVLLRDGVMRVVRGPKENRHRPSIDVLFRSAAALYRDRVAGVLLSGSDDDGTGGLMSVKRHGGITVVQDPADCDFARMPASALERLEPDFTLPLNEIGDLLARLVDGRIRVNERQHMSDPSDRTLPEKEGKPTDVSKLGTPSAFSCPECNGTLWELQDGHLLRYECRVGHAYSTEGMIEAQSDSVERALWSAVRALEESAALSRRVGRRARILEPEMTRKAAEREEHARVIRKLLLETQGG
ncbi:MAG: chemotaxis protein CheB [Bryobacteraceae bacterium]